LGFYGKNESFETLSTEGDKGDCFEMPDKLLNYESALQLIYKTKIILDINGF